MSFSYCLFGFVSQTFHVGVLRLILHNLLQRNALQLKQGDHVLTVVISTAVTSSLLKYRENYITFT